MPRFFIRDNEPSDATGFIHDQFQPELPTEGTLSGNRLSGAWSGYKANLYGIGEAMGSDWAKRKREENEVEEKYHQRMAARLGGVESYKDVDGVGSALNYVGGLAAQSLPYMAESVVGGVVTRGLSTGLRAASVAGRTLDATAEAVSAGKAADKALALRSSVGGAAASYPSSVGDILSNQRDQNPDGDMNLGAALVGGVPYAALNAVDPLNVAAARGVAFRSVNLLDGLKGKTGGLARAGATALKVGVQEGLNETGQEVINQGFGRMAVDPNATLTDDSAIDRYKESFVGGFALGGTTGAALGGWRRSQPLPAQNLLDPNAPPVQPPDAPPPGGLAPPASTTTPPALPITTQTVNGTTELSPERQQELLDYAKTRLAELEAKNSGTQDKTTIGPDGKEITIPGRPREVFTFEEKQEYDFLVKAGGDAQTLARVYSTAAPTTPTTATTPTAPTEPTAPRGPILRSILPVTPEQQIKDKLAQDAQDLADKRTEAERIAAEQRQNTLIKYGQHTTTDIGGAVVHNWAGKEVTNLGDLAKAQTAQMKADAKRITEYGIDPVAANEAEHAYAEAWRTAQGARTDATPVTPAIFKDKVFAGIVKGGQTVTGMAALTKHEFTKEAERGVGKANAVKLDTLEAFYKNLTGEALDRKSIEDAVAAKATQVNPATQTTQVNQADGNATQTGAATADNTAASGVANPANAVVTPPAPVARPKTEFELLGEQVEAIQNSNIPDAAKRAAVDTLLKGKNLVKIKALHDAAIAAEKPVEETPIRKDVRRVLASVFGGSAVAARDVEVTMDAMREGDTKANEIADRYGITPTLVRNIKSRGNAAFDAAAKKLGFPDSWLLLLRGSLEGTLNEDPEEEVSDDFVPGPLIEDPEGSEREGNPTDDEENPNTELTEADPNEDEDPEIGSRNAEVGLAADGEGDVAQADGFDRGESAGLTYQTNRGSRNEGGTRSHHRAALTRALKALPTNPKALEKLSPAYVSAILTDEKLLPVMDPAVKEKLVAIAAANDKIRIAAAAAERAKKSRVKGDTAETETESKVAPPAETKGKKKAAAKPAKPAKTVKATEPEVDLADVDPAAAAAKAWNDIAARVPTLRKFEDLPGKLQGTFAGFGKENWTAKDIEKFATDNKLFSVVPAIPVSVKQDGVKSLLFDDGVKAHAAITKTIDDYKRLLACLTRSK